MVIFSTALATSIVSLPHAALILTNAGPKVLVAAVAEASRYPVVASINSTNGHTRPAYQ